MRSDPKKRNRWLGLVPLLALLPVAAVVAGELELDITGSTLEQLYDLDITSVSKKEERLQETAAAVHVLTGADLLRMGITSIPDALRLVPGVQVARVDASKWAVSIRGFNSRTANKLLVLIDGRSIYNPLFAGVLWEARDLPLEDVERIEVIRGPGGSLWGANAVNGVINIITRSAADTQGGLVHLGGGTEERAFGTVRYGWHAGRGVDARVYGKFFDRDGGYVAAGEAHDDWQIARVGFRVDWKAGEQGDLTLSGDAYDGEVGESLGPGGSQDVEHSGSNLRFHWEMRPRSSVRRSLQAYYDRTDLDNINLGERRETFDLELEESRALNPRYGLVWGLGYRVTRDEIRDGAFLTIAPPERDDALYSAFAQGDFNVPRAELKLTLGAKLERNDYTGTELQPSLRLAWTPRPECTLWGAVSRAVRTPSRLEADITAPFAGPAVLRSETLVAHELGFRWQPGPRLAIDSAAFWNDYDELLTLEGPRLGNLMEGTTRGLETGVAWTAHERWRLDLAASWLDLDLELDPSSAGLTDPRQVEDSDPGFQAVLRSRLDLPRDVRLDAALRFVDDLEAVGVPSYTAMDLTLGWQATPRIDLSLIGRDLLEDHHAEQAGIATTEVERAVFAQLTIEF